MRLPSRTSVAFMGPVDVTFFEDVQGPCAATAFDSWLLLVRG